MHVKVKSSVVIYSAISKVLNNLSTKMMKKTMILLAVVALFAFAAAEEKETLKEDESLYLRYGYGVPSVRYGLDYSLPYGYRSGLTYDNYLTTGGFRSYGLPTYGSIPSYYRYL